MNNFNFKKINPKLIYAAFGGLLIALIAIVLLNSHFSKTAKTGTDLTAINQVSSTSPDVTISASNSGSLVDLNISPEKPEKISALSIRLTVPNQSKTKIAFTQSQSLVQNGWIFPINQVSQSSDGTVTNIDISAIYTTPGGFDFDQGFNLGSIVGISGLTVSFDKVETKVLDESAKELNLNFTTN
ncbi:MAG TPA: hypothetical protein VG895_01005 [Patescibacteria group bacterium]|nr:hypothetical protein [Patescibacteria group bacterium]